MRPRSIGRIALLVFAVRAISALGAGSVPAIEPLQLPTDVEQSLVEMADESDVLILGEIHGTQEMPQLVAALIDPLSKRGYGALALEVPHDAQSELVAWAKGESQTVPQFFAQPGTDGRGNEQLLALIRLAVRPPYNWQLICFDRTEAEMMRQMMERLPPGTSGTISEQAARLSPEDLVALSTGRDAAMAERLAAAKELPSGTKTLAICGNLHARTADHSPDHSPMKPFWPSMAAALVRDYPQWQIRSLNVEFFSGEYFNGGKVNRFTERPLERLTFRATPDDHWNAVLQLPTTTVATFLAPPERPSDIDRTRGRGGF